jgi:hypothetical protein
MCFGGGKIYHSKFMVVRCNILKEKILAVFVIIGKHGRNK